jgi:hypothetical protein
MSSWPSSSHISADERMKMALVFLADREQRMLDGVASYIEARLQTRDIARLEIY